HGESSEVVNAKTQAALANELIPIVCVGESREIREAGRTIEFVLEQVSASLAGFSDEAIGELVIAYEPVWAIGTGAVATPADAQQVCSAIRQHVSEQWSSGSSNAVRLLYGGSVKADNVAAIMAQTDVDGALVGGASLDPDEFVGIIRYRMHPADL
ncbi:MAG: triose-phosphate isomerase, partial [Actinomycetales bacterium]|nr:triose-phosphate isomerase [Actinomycetales bacterium]